MTLKLVRLKRAGLYSWEGGTMYGAENFANHQAVLRHLMGNDWHLPLCFDERRLVEVCTLAKLHGVTLEIRDVDEKEFYL